MIGLTPVPPVLSSLVADLLMPGAQCSRRGSRFDLSYHPKLQRHSGLAEYGLARSRFLMPVFPHRTIYLTSTSDMFTLGIEVLGPITNTFGRLVSDNAFRLALALGCVCSEKRLTPSLLYLKYIMLKRWLTFSMFISSQADGSQD